MPSLRPHEYFRMQLLKFIPIKLTIILVIGILIGRFFDLSILFSLLLTTVFLIATGMLFLKKQKRTNSYLFGTFAGVTTLCIGMLSFSLAQPKNHPDHYSNQSVDGVHSYHIKVREVLKPNPFSDRYIASVMALDSIEVSGKLLLTVKTDSINTGLKVDDELWVVTTLKSINPPLNPHQFDYRSYLNDLGIYHQLPLNSKEFLVKTDRLKTIYGIAATARNHIISKLKSANFGKEELAIIQALLLGQRNDISAETYTNYKNAGAVHILAVSGLHIGILLLLLQFILRPLEFLPKGRTVKLVVIVVLLWMFAFLAGMSASIVRAVTMFSFVAYALYLNRPSNTFNILALSMFFILLVVNPMLLYQVGFQMSYAAVFSIVWIYPKLQRFWFPKNKVVRKLWQLLSVSIAAQLGVLPLSLFYFHQFPGLFFISNLLIVPFLGIILGLGLLVITLALTNSLPELLAFLYNGLIRVMNSVIEWVAQQEAFIFRDIPFDTLKLVLSYAIICTMIFALDKSTFKRIAFLLIGIIGFQSWTIYSKYISQQQEKLIVIHKTRNTVLFHRKGNQLTVMASDRLKRENTLTDFKVGENIDTIQYCSLKNAYTINEKRLLIIDGLGILSEKEYQHDYVLLTQSPKLHLGRLIDTIRPRYIIADGSNYKSYIARWKKTCEKRKLPFHYTGEKGAYRFDLNK